MGFCLGGAKRGGVVRSDFALVQLHGAPKNRELLNAYGVTPVQRVLTCQDGVFQKNPALQDAEGRGLFQEFQTRLYYEPELRKGGKTWGSAVIDELLAIAERDPEVAARVVEETAARGGCVVVARGTIRRGVGSPGTEGRPRDGGLTQRGIALVGS